jgi:selenocysteine-specific elongation factor
LEFFDRHGVTLRRGDLRRINKHRLDLFHSAADENSDRPMSYSQRQSERLQVR